MKISSKRIKIIIIVGMLLIIGILILNKYISVDVSKNVPYEKSDILYQENLEKGNIVLYKSSTGFRHAFYSNELNRWNVSLNAEMNPAEGVSWTMINDTKTPIFTLAGIISNSQVKKILVKQKTVEKNAKIIKIDDNFSVWYVTFDVLEKGTPDPLKIEASSDTGEILWKDGVY